MTGRAEPAAAPPVPAQLTAIDRSLRKLEAALLEGDLEMLRAASDALRDALATLPVGEPRQLHRLRRLLAHCADLLGRSIGSNARALNTLGGPAAGSTYGADGAARVALGSSVDITT